MANGDDDLPTINVPQGFQLIGDDRAFSGIRGWRRPDLRNLPPHRRRTRMESLRKMKRNCSPLRRPALKQRNPVPTDRQSPYRILADAQFRNEAIFFGPGPAFVLISLSCLHAAFGPVTAGTADGVSA
jgi:hypothetical protein